MKIAAVGTVNKFCAGDVLRKRAWRLAASDSFVLAIPDLSTT